MTTTDWLFAPTAQPSETARVAAQYRQLRLTKPPGALGQAEALAVQIASLQDTDTPKIERVHITVFAADHGVAAEGVSAFPQAVTREMVRNFARGGAAINVLARRIGAHLEIIDLGVVDDSATNANRNPNRVGAGTANFVNAPAMTPEQLQRALDIGRQAAERAKTMNNDLFIGGEMGIGNTTAATVLACALLSLSAEAATGPGTGLDETGVAKKITVVKRALDHHRDYLDTPLEALRRLGGFEIAALVGSYVGCAQIGLPVLVDGFIATSAALIAARLNTGVKNWLLYSHFSAEPGHRFMLTSLGATPLLDFGMRLGEGSGAAIAVPLLRMACALHNEMATFSEAGVSEKANS